MKLIDKAVAVVIAKDGQGLIKIDDFPQSNDKSVEGLFQVLRRPGWTAMCVSNNLVAVPAMAEVNLQGMIYYIKQFKRIWRTCTHVDLDLSKVRDIYHQRDMEEYHKNPEVVPTVNPREWPKTLETLEEYTRGFHGVYGQPIIYELGDDLIALVDAYDTTYYGNVSKYFTHDE